MSIAPILTNTPDKDEHVPRTSPHGKMFTYNYGDYLVDARTFATRELYGGYVWTPDSRRTAECDGGEISTYLEQRVTGVLQSDDVPGRLDPGSPHSITTPPTSLH